MSILGRLSFKDQAFKLREDAILDAEGVGVVHAELVAANLRRPTRQIFAVEELDPTLIICSEREPRSQERQGRGEGSDGEELTTIHRCTRWDDR